MKLEVGKTYANKLGVEITIYNSLPTEWGNDSFQGAGAGGLWFSYYEDGREIMANNYDSEQNLVMEVEESDASDTED